MDDRFNALNENATLLVMTTRPSIGDQQLRK
jgi:hypothetical protein